jgi:dynein heavy chain
LNSVEPKAKKWITDMTWLNLVELSKIAQFSQVLRQIGNFSFWKLNLRTQLIHFLILANNDKAWKTWFDTDAPEEEVLIFLFEISNIKLE